VHFNPLFSYSLSATVPIPYAWFDNGASVNTKRVPIDWGLKRSDAWGMFVSSRLETCNLRLVTCMYVSHASVSCSNGHRAARSRFVSQMMQSNSGIHSYGSCLNNRKLPFESLVDVGDHPHRRALGQLIAE
jgi:hypothetical protein